MILWKFGSEIKYLHLLYSLLPPHYSGQSSKCICSAFYFLILIQKSVFEYLWKQLRSLANDLAFQTTVHSNTKLTSTALFMLYILTAKEYKHQINFLVPITQSHSSQPTAAQLGGQFVPATYVRHSLSHWRNQHRTVHAGTVQGKTKKPQKISVKEFY